LYLDLSNLSTIKSSAEAFQSKEPKLDVLWNNAGVSSPPAGSVSKQGFELQMGTNCLGPLLFTQLLLPQLQAAAKSAPRGTVRIIWTSSQVVDFVAPKGGFALADLDYPSKDTTKNYVTSKLGNWFLAHELAAEVGAQGIMSVVQNPGNLKTNLLRHYSGINFWAVKLFISPFLLYHAKFGAYTELWAGLSDDLTIEENGGYVIPWGRIHPAPRKYLQICWMH
jgi:NAD(P)-dependent dehydrogenase (short-subunit alcohol dehydrogenase family)